VKIIFFEGDINNAITGFRKDLVEQLTARGYEVIVVGFRAYKNEFGEIDNKITSLQLLELGQLSSSPINAIRSVVRLFIFLRKTKPKLCVAFNVRPILFLGLTNIFLKIPSIATITGTSTISGGSKLNSIFMFFTRFILKKYKVVFFQNAYDKKLFTDIGLGGVKVKVVPGSGVDTKYFKKECVRDSKIHDKYSDFLLVARIIKQKGILEYIEAARQIKITNPKIIFGLLGPYYSNSKGNNTISPEFIEKAEKEGIIKYFGFSNNVKEFMLASKCIVLPTYGEGMSNTLLEAASLEKPILASNVPGSKEIVDDQETGYLFEKQSVAALTSVLRKFLLLTEEEKGKMGVLARKKVISQFEKSIVIDSYLEEIRLIIK
jgi:galacturonosyltransferase